MSVLFMRSTLAAGGLLFFPALVNAMTVTVTPSAASPAPVGTMITFSAAVPDAPAARLWYRFRVRRSARDFQVIRDYGPDNALDWTASANEGDYDMEVSARNLDTGEEGLSVVPFAFASRVSGGQPVVSPTSNSLVFLYSAPACPGGSRIRVEFQAAGGATQITPYKPCDEALSMNFYIAGLLPATAYTAHHRIDDDAGIHIGPEVAFTTGALPAGLYSNTVIVPSTTRGSNPILLGAPLGMNPVASDLAGNVVWYGPDTLSFLTRAETGGEFWGIIEAPNYAVDLQAVRKIDLVGMTLLETNAARVNEQLRALGKRPISGFHHEARQISNSRIAVLADVEQILTDVQGPGAVDVIGDMILVFDSALNVVWTWDTFDHLDVTRAAVSGELCPVAGCPAFYLASTANDWTHGNSIQETPDGNLLYSSRHQDWLIKVDYSGGSGDGHVIYRLGKDGDFQILSDDPYPWFSHQHDGNFDPADPSRLMVFDDGNTRVAALGSGNSRGQVYQIDEQNRVARPLLNADLGVFSAAVGSAQRLRNGNYHFDAGFVFENSTMDSYSVEVDRAGTIRYNARQNVFLYRTFRMSDMYTPD